VRDEDDDGPTVIAIIISAIVVGVVVATFVGWVIVVSMK
jgi:hypothetical protein